MNKGQILVSNGTDVNPIYTSPSFSAWTGGKAAGPKLNLVINGITTTAPAIPSASTSASGIVTTGEQTFAGTKNFSGAVAVNNTFSVKDTLDAAGLINAQQDIQAASKVKSSDSSSYIDFSNNTELNIKTAKLNLNGEKILLSSSNYGTELPEEGMEEGQIFFLLT